MNATSANSIYDPKSKTWRAICPQCGRGDSRCFRRRLGSHVVAIKCFVKLKDLQPFQ